MFRTLNVTKNAKKTNSISCVIICAPTEKKNTKWHNCFEFCLFKNLSLTNAKDDDEKQGLYLMITIFLSEICATCDNYR